MSREKINYASHRQTKKSRKYQSVVARYNPNQQEINRKLQDQRVGVSRNARPSAPNTSWMTFFLLGLLVTSGAAQRVHRDNAVPENVTQSEDAASPSPANYTMSAPSETQYSASSVNATQRAQIGLFAAAQHYQNNDFSAKKRKPQTSSGPDYASWPLSKILEEDNVEALKQYLFDQKDLFERDFETQSPLLSEAAGKVQSNRIWKYLLDKGDKGGWKYFEKRPDLLIFHTVRVATLNSNTKLVLLLNKEGLVDEMKSVAAAFNNIAKAIHNSDVAYLDKFIAVIPEAKKIFADPVMRRRMKIIAEENSNDKMRAYLENKMGEYEKMEENTNQAKFSKGFRE